MTDHIVIGHYLVSLSRDAAFGEHEPGELPRAAACALLEQRVAPDEAGLAKAHDPRQPGFQGRRIVAELVPVQWQGALQTQRIAGAQTGGLDAEPGAGVEERVPQRRGVVRSAIQFPAVFAGVARMRDKSLAAGYRAFVKCETRGWAPRPIRQTRAGDW